MNYLKKIIHISIKRYKKSYLLASIVIFLTVFLQISAGIFFSSYNQTLENLRKEMYGAWHVGIYGASEEDYQKVKDHATISLAGEMKIIGLAGSSTDSGLGGVGSVDTAVRSMGRIKLVAGNFPENKQQIAVEMSSLTTLGYSYELGQKISLPIQVYDKNTKTFNEVNKEFTLCGVIRNYSNMWKTDNNAVASFIVSKDYADEFDTYKLNVFAKAKHGYEGTVGELSRIINKKSGSTLLKNSYTYYAYMSQIKVAENVLGTQWFSILIVILSVVVLISVFDSSIRKRRNSFVIMRTVGARKSQIVKSYCGEAFYCIALVLPVGILAGIGVPAGIYRIVHHFNSTVKFSVPLKSIAFSLAILLAGIIVTVVFEMVRILQIPLRGKSEINIVKNNKSRSFKPLTDHRIAKIIGKYSRFNNVISFLICFFICLTLSFSMYSFYGKYKDYSELNNTYTSDYDFGYMALNFNLSRHMTEKDMQKVRSTYGVDYVRAYKISDYYKMEWDKQGESLYSQIVSEQLSKKYVDNKKYQSGKNYATVFGLSDNNNKNYKYYSDNVDDGKFDYDGFSKGKSVILYLPSLNINQYGFPVPDDVSNNRNDKTVKKVNENSIKPGDKITIYGDKNDVTVTVCGIIRKFSDRNSQSFLFRPYSIIGNYKLAESLNENAKSQYEYVQVYGNKKVNYMQTDVELSKIKSDLYMQNFRQDKQNKLQNMQIGLLMSIIFNAALILISVLILSGLLESRCDADNQHDKILVLLGMDKKKLKKIKVKRIIINDIISIGLSIIIIFAFNVIKYYYNVIDYCSITDAVKHVYISIFADKLSVLCILLFYILFFIISVTLIYKIVEKNHKKI